jgi:hypothetical protein
MGVRCVGVIGPGGGFKSPALTHTTAASTAATKTDFATCKVFNFSFIFFPFL